MIDPFGSPARISELEQILPGTVTPVERASCMAELAWYLRQQDTRRSLRLAQEAERVLDHARHPSPQLSARIDLVQAEAYRLQADLARSEEALARSVRAFRSLGDRIGEADCLICDADRLVMAGQTDAALNQADTAVRLLMDGEDKVRARTAAFWALTLLSTTDGRAARQRSQELPGWVWPDPTATDEHPAVAAFAGYLSALLSSQRSDFPAAVTCATEALKHAEAAGLLLLKIHLHLHIGSAYGNLGDHTSALEWKERGYALAQPTGWPEAVGTGLASLAHTKGQIARQAEALDLFRAALQELQKLPGSRRYALTCSTYANSCLATGETEEALAWSRKGAAIAAAHRHQDAEMHALLGCARALNTLMRPTEVQPYLDRALEIARQRNDPLHEIQVLYAMAKTRLLLTGREVDGCLEAIKLMEEAVRIGRGIPGYIVRSDLFADLAAAHELLADFRTALGYERQSRAAWEQEFNKETSYKLAALQARFDTQRAREEAEHMKMLARAEAERAKALDQTNQTLELLGIIGKEITASLDTDAVFATLNYRLGVLLQAPLMSIGLLDEAGSRLDVRFRMEDGRPLPPFSLLLEDARSHAARAVREREEVAVDEEPAPPDPAQLNGLRPMASLLYCPLVIGDRVLGVLSVQHDRPRAFGPRERQIVRSVAAYAAIALANAQAYRSLDEALATLQDAQGRLVQQEKLASLGQLVAGVAHEVNTPIGILLSLSSLLVEEVEGLARQLKAQQLKRTDLVAHLEMADETARLMLANASRAADLVSAFKQVAADRTHDEARAVDLGDYLKEVAATVQPLLRPRGIALTIHAAPGNRVTTFPGLLAQVVTNLVQNAVTHAFDGVAAPALSITVQTSEDRQDAVELEIADNGVGMPPAVRAKAFEPFFTTRRSSGGTGLGLHVVHNIVTGPLQGSIDLVTAPGRGCRFVLHLPRSLRQTASDGLRADATLAHAVP